MNCVITPIAYLARVSDDPINSQVLHDLVRAWTWDRENKTEYKRADCQDPMAADGTIITIGAVPVLAIPIAHPLPDRLFLDDIAQNHAFPTWREAVARHGAHLIVRPLLGADAGGADVFRAGLATLRVASALAALPDVVGVLWGPSGVFHDRAVFAERRPQHRKTDAELMIRPCWHGRPRPHGDGIGLLTRGLVPFAGREVWHPPCDAAPDTIYGRVLSVTAHLIAAGASAESGVTAGPGAARFRTVPHRMADGQDVLRLAVTRDLAPV